MAWGCSLWMQLRRQFETMGKYRYMGEPISRKVSPFKSNCGVLASRLNFFFSLLQYHRYTACCGYQGLRYVYGSVVILFVP